MMWRHPAWRWVRSLCVLSLALWLMPGCVNRMFYYPDSHIYRNADTLPVRAQDVFFKSLDGTELHGWYLPSPSSNVIGTVIHFHGNAQNITAHIDFVDWLPLAGFNLFTFDYRGYGRSHGRPSRKGLYMDGVAAVQEAFRLPGVQSNRVFIIGQSLGGATALAVVGRHPELPIQAMVIDSAFISYREIVRDKIREMPLLSLLATPLSYVVIKNDYSPDETLSDIQSALLFMHGTRDEVIPVRQSQLLYDAANEPKKLILIDGGMHISGLYSQQSDIAPQIIQFFTEQLD